MATIYDRILSLPAIGRGRRVAPSVCRLLPLVAVACSVTPEPSKERIGVGSVALSESKGVYAYPTKVTGGVPTRDASGKVVPSWSGSLGSLIAADALGACDDFAGGASLPDEYISYLRDRMNEAPCDAAPVKGAPSVPGVWRSQRSTPVCNIETTAGKSQPIAMLPHDRSAYRLAAPPGLTGSASVDVAVAQGQLYVDAAEVNLCMAQAARESMLTAPGLLLSNVDQVEVLEFIRERSQLAMLQYAMLGLAFTANGDGPDTLNYGSSCTEADQCLLALPLLHAWATQASSKDALAAMGRDAASAIALHAAIVRDLSETFARAASAQAEQVGPSATDFRWGATSYRSRLLALLFGGDPLGTDAAAHGSLWQGFPGTPGEALPAAPPYVAEPLPSVRAVTLLGLARAADAVFLSANGARSARVIASRDQMYRAVEASLRFPDCAHAGAPGEAAAPCSARAADPSIPTLESYTSSYLWQRYRIAPADANAVVTALLDAFPYPSSDGHAHLGALRVTGRTEALSGDALHSRAPGLTGTWIHADPAWEANAPSLVERARSYVRPFVIPPALDKRIVPAKQGFFDGGPGTNGRLLGATAALASVRDALRRPTIDASDPRAGYFGAAQTALPIIDAAIGKDAVLLRAGTAVSCPPSEDCQLVPTSSLVAERTAAKGATDMALVATPTTGLEGTLEQDPSASAPGAESAASALKRAPRVAPVTTAAIDAATERWTYALASQASAVSLLSDDASTSTSPYRLLVDGVTLATTAPVDSSRGYALAVGGFFGQLARDVWNVSATDWTRPARDPLGFPVDWVPTMDVVLAGGAPGQEAVSFYLDAAEDVAEKATSEMQTAIARLIEQQSDQDAADAAMSASQALAAAENASLCGVHDAPCDTTMGTVRVAYPQLQLTLAGPEGAVKDATAAFRPALDGLNEGLVTTFPGMKALGDHVNDADLPPFPEYTGGSLQALLQTEWSAIRTLVRSYEGAALQVEAQIQAYVTADFEAFTTSWGGYDCTPDAMTHAFQSGFGYQPAQKPGWDSRKPWDPDVTFDATPTQVSWKVLTASPPTWSPAALEAQEAACERAKSAAPAADANRATAATQVWATMATQRALVQSASEAVVGAGAALASALAQADLAKARARVESDLSTAGASSRMGLRLRFYGKDLDSARASMLRARVAALTARRAIEATYLVDLSSLGAPEAFVDPPAQWVDDVFNPDLDGPRWLNLNLTVSPSAAGSYDGNRLVSYVRKLRDFVKGYAVKRHTARVPHDSSTPADVDVLTLAGPDAHVVDATGKVGPLLPGAFQWSFYCKESARWVAHPALNAPVFTAAQSVATACGGAAPRPVKARLTFSLDPWGRLSGSVSSPPASDDSVHALRHNTRLGNLAVYLQGTDIKDCKGASDPETCRAAQFLVYDLSATGPAWTTAYDESWHALSLPTGNISSAKADLGVRVLDLDFGHTALLGDVGRGELIDRPIGDVYTLEIDTPADVVRLERLERVQIAVQSTYWVKQ